MTVIFPYLGGKGALPLNVDILGCDKQPCVFRRGEYKLFSITFKLAKKVQKFIPMVVIPLISKLPLPIPCYDNDCAKASGLTMPLKAGVKNTITMINMIPYFIPNIPPIQYELQAVDENQAVVSCFKVTVEIQ